MSDDLWTNITLDTLGISPPSSQTHLVSFVFPKCHINEPKINKVLKVKVAFKTFFVGTLAEGVKIINNIKDLYTGS